MSLDKKQHSIIPGIRVVEASAGSGKTYALAKRYVQILLNPWLAQDDIPMRSILAITFTNKAAYAMKGRILEFLKKIALGSLPLSEEKEILGPIGLTQPEARPRAIAIMDELIHNYNFFQVQTIDSFINALLSGCAFKIGLSAGFKIKRDFTEYLEYCLDRMIERAAVEKESYEILARFLHQYLFLEHKTGWFPKKDMLDLLKALYGQSNTYGRDFRVFNLAGEDLMLRKKKILVLFRKLQESLPEGTHSRFVESLNNFLNRYHEGFDFDQVSDYFGWETVPVKKGIEIPKELDRQWEQIQKQLRQLSEAEAYSLFNPYVEVFNQIHADFHVEAAKDDVLFLPELNRRARALFDEGLVTVEELYYRLATRFRHYLLDEFQDTSRLQWQNLNLMIEEALASGGTFFYVGDKKQAIYGFRGGEVKLFDEIKANLAHFEVQTEELRTNYRSSKAIVDFNNTIFSQENLRRFITELDEEEKDNGVLSPSDIDEIENIFHASQQEMVPGHEGGLVKIEYVDQDDRESRHEDIRLRLLALLKDLKGRFTYNQIAILTRSNTEIEEVTSWLMAEGIFVESERTLNIAENSLILEIMAFLRFLDSPIDNLSFAQFLTGDIFTRVAGISKEEMHSFLFSLRARQTQEKELHLYTAFREAYPKIWENIFADFFKNVGLFPLYELASSVLRRLKIFENFANEHGFLTRFLELIKEKEDEHTDLGSFLENFESLNVDELFVNVVNSDAIKILTIHKAKGLEFPVVIIPFLGIKVHAASGGGLGQQSYILDMDEDHMKLLRIKKKYLKFSEKLSEIQRRERVRSFISELNNIYVALTRAEHELYAFVSTKAGSRKNMVRSLIPEQCLQVGHIQEYPSKLSRKKEGQLGLPAAEEYDWINFLREEFSDTEFVFDREKARRGEILHALLAGVGNLYEADKAKIIQETIEHVRAQYPQFTEQHGKDFAGILADAGLKSFFVIPKAQVFLEREIVNRRGDTKRIDRMIIKGDEVWVIDYKSSQEGRDSFLKQVGEYCSIIREINPQKSVRGFLIYLDDGSFEEVRHE